MSTIPIVLIAIVAVEHLYFLYLEMFAWTKPSTLKAFSTTPSFAAESKVLAANQGLYNGFLAAGLLWAIVSPQPFQKPLAVFFLGCIVVAGIFGGLTVTRRILMIQALPAILALLSLSIR